MRMQPLRTLIILATLLLAASTLLPTPVASAQNATRDFGAESGFLASVNGQRAAAGLAPLAMSGSMSAAADGWTASMVNGSFLAHASDIVSGTPGGWTKVGENVGRGQSVASLTSAFMASAGHRANIMDASYTHIGIAVYNHPTDGRMYTTHRFAALPGAAAPAPVAPTPVPTAIPVPPTPVPPTPVPPTPAPPTPVPPTPVPPTPAPPTPVPPTPVPATPLPTATAVPPVVTQAQPTAIPATPTPIPTLVATTNPTPIPATPVPTQVATISIPEPTAVRAATVPATAVPTATSAPATSAPETTASNNAPASDASAPEVAAREVNLTPNFGTPPEQLAFVDADSIEDAARAKLTSKTAKFSR